MGENPKKYHVTDDGDIYRINEDGSFTSMGNAEKMSSNTHKEIPIIPTLELSANENSIKASIKKNNRGVIIGVITLIFLLGGISFFFLFRDLKTDTVPLPYGLNEDIRLSTETKSKKPLVEIEQPITENKSVNSYDTPQKEVTKVVSNQSSQSKIVGPRNESESLAKSSNNYEDKIKKQDVIDFNKIYSAVEVQAEFPGGDRARRQWLRDNIKWPVDANGQQLHGEVELDFVIERDGSISNVKVSYSENSDLNASAVKLISSMPKWSPAMVKNQPVRSPMGITLFF